MVPRVPAMVLRYERRIGVWPLSSCETEDWLMSRASARCACTMRFPARISLIRCRTFDSSS